jgi:hypothetical protein
MVEAEAEDELIPLYDGAGGATCAFFNVGGRLRWHNRKGDWKDANGAEQGPLAIATASIESIDRARTIEWDVTALATSWIREPGTNTGILLAAAPGGSHGDVFFHSREADDPKLRPQLVLEFEDGSSRVFSADADAHLDCSTTQSLGGEKMLHGGTNTNIVIRFALDPNVSASGLRRALLKLTTTAKQYGNSTLGVYVLDSPKKALPGKPELGIANGYPRDRGIERDPDVVMASNFESSFWFRDWSQVRPFVTISRITSDAFGFEPLDGKALSARIPAGGQVGLDITYDFNSKTGSEPEEIYFRYYLRLANDWMPVLDGGKLPGISGTYNRAGWGGRKSDGKNGWSMRGGFAKMPEKGNPLRPYTTLNSYAYHADTEGRWGDEWVWDIGLRGLVRRGRWYCIEQYLRLNRIGMTDGQIKVWVDGELAFDRTGFRVRDIPELRIEKIWMNVFHGGTTPSAADMHLYIDNVVIAKKYIGPMRRE